MPKEYRTIQEVAGPLMLVRDVERIGGIESPEEIIAREADAPERGY